MEGALGDRQGEDLLSDEPGLRPKDLLFCTHEPFLPLSGGCTIGNLRIVQALQKRGHLVRVLSPLQADERSAKRASLGAELRRFEPWRMHRSISLRFPKYLLYSGLYFFALWRECSRRRPDALFVRNAVLGLPVLLVARLRSLPCAISYTDLLSALLGGDRRFPKPLIALLRAYEARLPRYFDQVLVISSGIAEALVKEGGVEASRIRVTLDGADVSLFDRARFPASSRAAVRRELKLTAKEKLVVFHGTLEAHHGQETLPRIISLAPGLRFLIIAGGPGYEALKAELQGQPNTTVLPFQPPEKVARYAAAAEMGMVPYEPNAGLDLVFTLKLLEYFALGLPVVTFRLKSAEAVFGRFPQMLVSEDEAGFAANLRKALKVRPSAKLRQLIKKDFSWDAVTRRIVTALEAL